MQKVNYTYLVTSDSLTVYGPQGRRLVLSAGDGAFSVVLAAIANSKSFSELATLVKPGRAMKQFSQGAITVRDGRVYYRGEEVLNSVADRIREFIRLGLSWEPLGRFLENLMSNPSSNSRLELYKFLEHKHMPITADGHFLAYRGLRDDYYSKHADPNAPLISGRMDSDGCIYNGIGEVISVRRSYVDDNQNQGCGRGLHIGSLEYATSWGPRVVVVKVNPRDAVCVPHDSNWQKLRACAYTVVEDYTGALPITYGMYGQFGQFAGTAVDRQKGKDTFTVSAITEEELRQLGEAIASGVPKAEALAALSEQVSQEEERKDPLHKSHGPFLFVSCVDNGMVTRVKEITFHDARKQLDSIRYEGSAAKTAGLLWNLFDHNRLNVTRHINN